MLEDVEKRSSMKRMESTGEMTEAWGTPALIECRLEWKLSTLTAIDLAEKNTTDLLNESVVETKNW